MAAIEACSELCPDGSDDVVSAAECLELLSVAWAGPPNSPAQPDPNGGGSSSSDSGGSDGGGCSSHCDEQWGRHMDLN